MSTRFAPIVSAEVGGARGRPGNKGDPGGNIMAVGSFVGLPGISVPIGTPLIHVSAYGTALRSNARYREDPTLTDAQIAARPRWMAKTSDGRRWRLDEAQETVRHFGAVGDGVTNDYAALQAALDYAVENQCTVLVPGGRYVTNATLVINGLADSFGGWGLVGTSRRGSQILQSTDNIATLQVGPYLTSGHRIENLTFGHLNQQLPKSDGAGGTIAQTNAVAVLFTGMVYSGSMQNIGFTNSYWAMRVAPGVAGPWANTWSGFYFTRSITGGCMDWTNTIGGTPTNTWSTFYVDATAMVEDTLFKGIRGYNFVWNNLEFNGLHNNRCISFAVGSQVVMNSLKIENVVRYDRDTELRGAVILAIGCTVDLGYFFFGSGSGDAVMAPTAPMYLFSGGATADSAADIRIGKLEFALGQATANTYIFGGDPTKDALEMYRRVNINKHANGLFAAPPLTNLGGTQVANVVSVPPWNNQRMSPDMGNADYTFAWGDAAAVRFDTALTAPRTLTIPSDGNVFAGMEITVLVGPNVTSAANPLKIVSGTRTIATVTAATAQTIRIKWRRVTGGSSQAGWAVVSVVGTTVQ